MDKSRFEDVLKTGGREAVCLKGSPGHMGISLRMRTDLFPKIHKGTVRGISFEFSFGGTLRGLSFVNEDAYPGKEAIDTRRLRVIKQHEKRRYCIEEKI